MIDMRLFFSRDGFLRVAGGHGRSFRRWPYGRPGFSLVSRSFSGGYSTDFKGRMEREREQRLKIVRDLERVGGAVSPYQSASPVALRKEIIPSEEDRLREFVRFRDEAEEKGLSVEFACSAVVERAPVIIPDLEDWEIDFYELQQKQWLKRRKMYPRDAFRVRAEEKHIRRDQLWAFDILDAGSGGRLSRLNWDKDLKKEYDELVSTLPENLNRQSEEEEQKAAADDGQKPQFDLKVEGDTVLSGEEAAEMLNDFFKKNGMMDQNADSHEGGETDSLKGEDAVSELRKLQEARETQDRMKQERKEKEDFSDLLDDEFLDEEKYRIESIDGDTRRTDINKAEFEPQPRITDADLTNDFRSIRRRLQRRIHLIVKIYDPMNDSKEPVWRFPTDFRRDESEVFLDGAERAVEEQLGKMDIFYLGRCPAGYVYDKYPESLRKERGAYGSHTLFYRGKRLRGHVNVQSESILDYAWITNDEIGLFVPNFETDAYWSIAHQFMDD